jgi:hypothetical protein
MDELRRGTWMVNTSKHLNTVRADSEELIYFEATEQAGKAGNLLARMAADDSETLTRPKVIEYARAANVRITEVDRCLRLLKTEDKVDFTTDSADEITNVEVYSFSTNDALLTTARLFDRLDPSDIEQGSIETLERTFYLPQTPDEMLETLTGAGLRDRDATLALKLQDALGLVKSSTAGMQTLYYNEYAFNDDPQKALRAIASLSSADVQAVQDIQHVLTEAPGYPMELLQRKFPSRVVEMMEGIGMLDAMPVRSPNGQAVYVTIPQLRGASIDQPALSIDVFHKAKTLLNCLRYGQFHSVRGRGKIVDDAMLVNVVRKLIRGEELRPSTAAGEDYRILEREGVIATRPYGSGMFYMRLRQKEVGIVVLQMIQHHAAVPEGDLQLLTYLGAVATERDIPEERRAEVLKARTASVTEAQNTVLQVVRTGARSQ